MKVQVKKSVEGGKFREVIIEDELMNALMKFDKANETLTFLIVNGLIKVDSDISDGLFAISEDCRKIFRKYELDKYDVRANYKWDEAKKIV